MKKLILSIFFWNIQLCKISNRHIFGLLSISQNCCQRLGSLTSKGACVLQIYSIYQSWLEGCHEGKNKLFGLIILQFFTMRKFAEKRAGHDPLLSFHHPNASIISSVLRFCKCKFNIFCGYYRIFIAIIDTSWAYVYNYSELLRRN